MKPFSIVREKKIQSYVNSTAYMEKIVDEILMEEAKERIWLLECKDVYTAGNMSLKSEVLSEDVHLEYSSRGGKITYHGPGQRIIYTILNLKRIKIDIRKFVSLLECWIIDTLKCLNVIAYTIEGKRGIWVKVDNEERKIAAIGLKVKKGIVYHGIAVNINTDLSKFQKIIPCGLENCHMTSLKDIGIEISMAAFDKVLIDTLPEEFFHRIEQ